MNRRHLSLFLGGVAVVILAGLGLGYGGARWWRPDGTPSTQENASSEAPRVAQGPVGQERAAEAVPAPGGKDVSSRALLIGVTKYDHLPKEKHLAGPANDVRLMRTLLQQRYRFPAAGIVTLAEDEGKSDRRPTRANIEREFRRLADLAREGDQVVILIAGHGARQPANPDNREPDGIDEIFLPADVEGWRGFPDKCPNALVDKEMGKWLHAITAKKAHVWIIFDCCHSGTMTRGIEVVRELPPDLLVPSEELDKARQRAAKREQSRGGPEQKAAAFVPREPSDYLVAVYACRETETTPESPQPVESASAVFHGLLTYSVVDILTKSADSKAPLTYRELVQRIQVRYAARPQGSPTPLVEGRGQDRVVLGMEQPARSRLLLMRQRNGYKVNAGDLYGLTNDSVLAVYSPAGQDAEPKLLGHVRVGAVKPFEAVVEPCAYENTPLVKDLPELSSCRLVFIDYGGRRFRMAIQTPKVETVTRQKLLKALEPLAGEKEGLIEIVNDLRQAEWLVRLDKGKLQLVEASANRPPFALPEPDSPHLSDALRRELGKVFRARNLIALANRFEGESYRGDVAVNIEVEVLDKSPKARGEGASRPAEGWVFRPGDAISFRVKNKSQSLALDVTLLIIGCNFEIEAFYPKKTQVVKSLKPGDVLNTPQQCDFNADPPFGPEYLVVIAVPATNPPADFGALAQPGLQLARAVDRGNSLRSPLGQLLQHAMYRSGSRGHTTSFADQHGMRVLTWRTEPK